MRPAIEQAHEAGEAHAAAPETTTLQPASVYAAHVSSDTFGEADAEGIPVLPTTLLGLELLSKRSAFDLHAATRIVRGDLGAVLQLFRLLAQDSSDQTDPPMRLETSLASLPRKHLLQALAKARPSRRRSRFAAFAEHAAAVAKYAEMVAGTLGLAAEPARLVGLLHELGHVPAALGWNAWPADAAVCCDRLARAHGLPATLRNALNEVHREAPDSVWTAVVAAAHELLPPRA